VLQLFGFVVDFVPLHAENFGEHAFDQVMALEDAVGDFAALLFERDFARGADVNESVALQAADGHGDGGSGDFEPAGQGRGDDGLTFGFGLGDGLQVVLFGDGDSHALQNLLIRNKLLLDCNMLAGICVLRC
jgi:hypothetical protein